MIPLPRHKALGYRLNVNIRGSLFPNMPRYVEQACLEKLNVTVWNYYVISVEMRVSYSASKALSITKSDFIEEVLHPRLEELLTWPVRPEYFQTALLDATGHAMLQPVASPRVGGSTPLIVGRDVDLS